jgi:uncharacterized protein YaaR (DUF327 family)
MFLVLPTAVYEQLTGEVGINRPTNPGIMPNFIQGADPSINAIATMNWQKQKQQYDTITHVNKALIALTKKALSPEYRKVLNNLFIGTANIREYHDFFMQIFIKWGKPKAQDTTMNNERLHAPWDPSTRDFSDVLRQIRDATSTFAFFINQRKPEHELVRAAEQIILNTGLFETQYRAWRAQPDAMQIVRGHASRRGGQIKWICGMKRHSLQANSDSEGMPNAEAGVEEAEEADAEFLNSLQNFSEANANNANTFNTMTNEMYAAIQALDRKMHDLALSVASKPPAAAPTAPVYAPPPVAYAPPAAPYVPAPTPPPVYGPPAYQQQQQPFAGYGGGYNNYQGGRNRGSGRGHGRGYQQGRGYQTPTPQYGVTSYNMERISMACSNPTFMQTKPTSPTTKSTSKTGITAGAMDMMSQTIITAGIVRPLFQDMCIGQLETTPAADVKRQNTKRKCDGEERVVALLTKLILYV